ncbi:MAG: hypothetical protein LBH09_03590 [Peptococcaceae bacterium]|jgi:hypothetical protein|nr:hypothetical protein [Peptococcaceae bacterium]
MDQITYEVLEKLGVLSESPRGWTKELRLVDWNNRGPRYDLREWSPGDHKASRGITLSLREMRILQEILMETEFPEIDEDETIDASLSGASGAFGEAGVAFGAGAGKAESGSAAAEKPGRRKAS